MHICWSIRKISSFKLFALVNVRTWEKKKKETYKVEMRIEEKLPYNFFSWKFFFGSTEKSAFFSRDRMLSPQQRVTHYILLQLSEHPFRMDKTYAYVIFAVFFRITLWNFIWFHRRLACCLPLWLEFPKLECELYNVHTKFEMRKSQQQYQNNTKNRLWKFRCAFVEWWNEWAVSTKVTWGVCLCMHVWVCMRAQRCANSAIKHKTLMPKIDSIVGCCYLTSAAHKCAENSHTR